MLIGQAMVEDGPDGLGMEESGFDGLWKLFGRNKEWNREFLKVSWGHIWGAYIIRET